MNAVPFDTLKLAQRLESAGFSREQAAVTAQTLAETLANDLATKSDLGAMKSELRGDLRTEAATIRTENGDNPHGDGDGPRGYRQRTQPSIRPELLHGELDHHRGAVERHADQASGWRTAEMVTRYTRWLSSVFGLLSAGLNLCRLIGEDAEYGCTQ